MKFVTNRIARVFLQPSELKLTENSKYYIYFDQHTREALGGFPQIGAPVILVDVVNNQRETVYVEYHQGNGHRLDNPSFVRNHLRVLQNVSSHVIFERTDDDEYTLNVYIAK